MIPTAKVLWGEGLFIRPQHFQQQDRYHEWRLAQAMMTMHPYAWGVRQIRIDMDALKAGRFAYLSFSWCCLTASSTTPPLKTICPRP